MYSQPVKRACDSCHRRKVKCDGGNSCRNCAVASLRCTYNAIPQKKGPKGSRARVIHALRAVQLQTSLVTKVRTRLSGVDNQPAPASQLPLAGLVTGELIKDCLAFFFAHMYPQVPVLNRKLAEQQVMYMEQNHDAYCMLTSMAAFTMLQPGKSLPSSPADPFALETSPGANVASSMVLIEEATRVRQGYSYLEPADGVITLNSIVTSYFLYACHHGLEMHSKAWYHLREATTLIMMCDMHQEKTYQKWDAVEASLRRRLFWLVFVAERAYALKHGRPVTLQASINLPTSVDDPNDPLASELGNFLTQVDMFRPISGRLVSIWADVKETLSAAYLASLRKQSEEFLNSCRSGDPQATDLNQNSSWLQSMVQQLSTKGSDASPVAAAVARDTFSAMVASFPDNHQLVGTKVIESIFESASSLVHCLAMLPVPRSPFATTPRNYLSRVLEAVASVRLGGNQYLPLLMHVVDEVLPKAVNPMLANPPEDLQLGNIDIFDGFGNAGLGTQAMSVDTTSFDAQLFKSEFNDMWLPQSQGVYNKSPPVTGGMAQQQQQQQQQHICPQQHQQHINPQQHQQQHVNSQQPRMSPQFSGQTSSPTAMSALSTSMEFPRSLADFGCQPPILDALLSPIGFGHSMNHQSSGRGLSATSPSLDVAGAMSQGLMAHQEPMLPNQQVLPPLPQQMSPEQMAHLMSELGHQVVTASPSGQHFVGQQMGGPHHHHVNNNNNMSTIPPHLIVQMNALGVHGMSGQRPLSSTHPPINLADWFGTSSCDAA